VPFPVQRQFNYQKRTRSGAFNFNFGFGSRRCVAGAFRFNRSGFFNDRFADDHFAARSGNRSGILAGGAARSRCWRAADGFRSAANRFRSADGLRSTAAGALPMGTQPGEQTATAGPVTATSNLATAVVNDGRRSGAASVVTCLQPGEQTAAATAAEVTAADVTAAVMTGNSFGLGGRHDATDQQRESCNNTNYVSTHTISPVNRVTQVNIPLDLQRCPVSLGNPRRPAKRWPRRLTVKSEPQAV